MRSDYPVFLDALIYFLPFAVFLLFNNLVNVKRDIRYRQYPMPFVALGYCAGIFALMETLSQLLKQAYDRAQREIEAYRLMAQQAEMEATGATNITQAVTQQMQPAVQIDEKYIEFILFNICSLVLYLVIKRILTLIFSRSIIDRDSFIGNIIDLFYDYNTLEDRWYLREQYVQLRLFLKTAYLASCAASSMILYYVCRLYLEDQTVMPFYPVFSIIVLGELFFFFDGLRADEEKSSLDVEVDKSRRIAMYPLVRKPLRELFGDKLSAEGTTVNNGMLSASSVEDVLLTLEREGGHIGRNYSAFIRKKMEGGLKPNVDYVRSGYDLSTGKSLLFNTPFYDKLNPYMFYAVNRQLLSGGKVLVVLGRHGTEDDLSKWIAEGMKGVSNIPDMWRISTITAKPVDEENMPDIGIISPSAVHDLDIHKNNMPFLRKVSFVIIVEPSRLITTAQIGLNLLVKCCGKERPVTFCSMDRNCDGLVDALSHILMTGLTEVSATEYPHGMSSFMYWTADDDYLQHRILPGISRSLGIGTEISMVALKNQVKKTVWYGGDAFPVTDAHWIAKQYYYDLLTYARQKTTQETFDTTFRTSFSMSDERVSDYSFITVEDERNNLFETRRNFATIAEQQGFVNVISSEYMLREYMAANTEMFTVDAKAIPYITADYARTRRNAILSLCLQMCIDSVQEDQLKRTLSVQNIDTEDPVGEIWKEVCVIFDQGGLSDKKGTPILTVTRKDGRTVQFEKKDTILYKREYNIESGRFESVYTIENTDFSRIILDDLQNASYIAERESKDFYIGTELKGHVYQKYMPGQFITLNGKYYEMISTTADNKILVRRASEFIGSRLAYRQVRNYKISHIEDSSSMGALKSVNNIDIHYQYADFSVETPAYWKLLARNNFDSGDLVKVNGVPVRDYHHKQILKFDFSRFGDAFTDSVRMTLTNLLNETFVTLFAENQAFISAVTPGVYDAPLTYSLELAEGVENADKCIFIIEDSQLDIGLLVAVERNVNRILQIITDYLSWNDEQIEISKNPPPAQEKQSINLADEQGDAEKPKKKGFFARIIEWFKNLFSKLFKKKDKKKKDQDNITPQPEDSPAAAPAAQNPQETEDAVTPEAEMQPEEPAETPAEETVPEEAAEEVQEETPAEETVAETEATSEEAEETTEASVEEITENPVEETEQPSPQEEEQAEEKEVSENE